MRQTFPFGKEGYDLRMTGPNHYSMNVGLKHTSNAIQSIHGHARNWYKVPFIHAE